MYANLRHFGVSPREFKGGYQNTLKIERRETRRGAGQSRRSAARTSSTFLPDGVVMQISILLLLSLLTSLGWTRKIPDINWISTNPIFDVSNTDHVISVRIGDRVSIKCPKSDGAGKYEYSYIYMVSDEEYDHCFLAKPRLVGACDNQTINASINIVFRSFTPTPGGFEFQPGHNYFLISTSDGTQEGIDRKKDGLCTTKQMKIKFEVESDRRGIESPKFAARTFKKDRDVEQSTPVLYLVHDGSDIDDDDGGSNACSYLVSISALLIYRYLL
uniref:Ephrin RBD domain-containing protein n=1 Tax=Caenorhabditis japonica TaxID=281687 RepID=A0A8R1HQ15_CAEJA